MVETVLKYVYLDVIIHHVLSECPSLSQLGYLSLCFFLSSTFSLFFACLYLLGTGIVLGPRFHQEYGPQADIKFMRTTTSEHADWAKKCLVDGAWYFWWAGENLFLSISALQ